MVFPITITPSLIFYILLALIINLIYYIILGIRFASIVNIIGGKISYIHSFYVFCITKFSSTITPFIAGSLISKPLAAKHYADLPINKGILITIFEQLIDFFVLIILSPLIFLFLGTYFFHSVKGINIIIGFSLLIFVCIFFFAFKYKYFIELFWKLKSFFPKYIINLGKKYGLTKKNTLMTFSQIKKQFLNKKTFIIVMPYTLIQILLIPLVLQFIITAVNFKVSYPTVFIIYFIPTIIGRLSGIPGGFGSTDITLGGILLYLGMDPLKTTFVVICFRLISLGPAIIIGGYLTLYLSTKYSIKIFSPKN